jgi:2-aminoadipate transaminase
MDSLDWSGRLARRAHELRHSAVRELLKITEQPDFISFGGGMPAPELFPIESIAEASARVLRDRGSTALQYGTTEGYRPLRNWITEHLRADGVPCEPENVLITTGSQQALDLLGKLFVDRGDPVLVESPTYLAVLQAWHAYGARYHTVAADDEGMVVDGLEPRLRAERPRVIYCVPNFQNPSGVTLTTARRESLVRQAGAAGIPVVEDDPYRALRYEGDDLIRLQALDPANVVGLGSFSKLLAPGLRVGWAAGPHAVIDKMVLAKQSTDLHTSTFNQMIVYECLRMGVLELGLPRLRAAYRSRRDAMLEAVARYFPSEVRWTRPAGGMFLWVTLPAHMDAAELLARALVERVAFVPGAAFHADGGGRNTFRLNFSNMSEDMIAIGVERLGRLLATVGDPLRAAAI